MSAYGDKADSLPDPSVCPLIGRSGHSRMLATVNAVRLVSPQSYEICGINRNQFRVVKFVEMGVRDRAKLWFSFFHGNGLNYHHRFADY